MASLYFFFNAGPIQVRQNLTAPCWGATHSTVASIALLSRPNLPPNVCLSRVRVSKKINVCPVLV